METCQQHECKQQLAHADFVIEELLIQVEQLRAEKNSLERTLLGV